MKFLKILSLSLALSVSGFAMKYGTPFRFNITAFVGGMSFGQEEAPITFPAGNGMREEDMLSQLRQLAARRCQSALNTGLANSVFSMQSCQQWFDPHLQYFADYVFRQHNNNSHEFYGDVRYVYSEGFYSAKTGDNQENPDYIVLAIGCRDLEVSN